jgi:hypothetical protein
MVSCQKDILTLGWHRESMISDDSWKAEGYSDDIKKFNNDLRFRRIS